MMLLKQKDPFKLVYTALFLECLSFRFAALLEGVFTSLNLRIQALKLYIHYYIDMNLKEVIWNCYGEHEHSEN